MLSKLLLYLHNTLCHYGGGCEPRTSIFHVICMVRAWMRLNVCAGISLEIFGVCGFG